MNIQIKAKKTFLKKSLQNLRKSEIFFKRIAEFTEKWIYRLYNI